VNERALIRNAMKQDRHLQVAACRYTQSKIS